MRLLFAIFAVVGVAAIVLSGFSLPAASSHSLFKSEAAKKVPAIPGIACPRFTPQPVPEAFWQLRQRRTPAPWDSPAVFHPRY